MSFILLFQNHALMKCSSFLIICLLFTASTTFAQQNIGTKKEAPVSPEINSGNTVTLRLNMPNARQVLVKGDWMKQNATAPMTRNAEGLWFYTSGVLPSDMYTYTFIVDGQSMIDPLNVYAVRDVSSLFSIFIIDGGNRSDYEVKEVSHGTVTERWYYSPSLNMERRMTIYTPPGYESSGKDFPVLYLLHGMGGDETAWATLGRLPEIMDNLIAQKKAEPMIVIMPNGNVAQQAAPGASSDGFPQVAFYLPHTMDGVFETSFKDILHFVENNYRVKKDKANRAIAGLSMGGFHALFISANYPNTFDYVGLFSPAVNPLPNVHSSIYDNEIKKLTTQKNNGLKLYWIGIGKEDFLYKDVAAFREKLDSLHFSYRYHESPRWHMWSNWRAYMLEFVPQLFK